MKTASCILGDAFFAEGFEVQDAPRYGAERRGAPIFAFVRADRHAINERGVITRPDLVVVADETLVTVAAAGVLQGLSDRTVLLINSAEPAAVWRERLKLACPVVTLPASGDATERAALPHIGAICAGAAARLLGVISRASLETAIAAELAIHGANVVALNREHALAVFDALAPQAGMVAEGCAIAVTDQAPPQWIELSAETAEIAAPDIHAAATSVRVPTGLWRTLRPVIDYEHCNRCSWICSTFCPDSAIAVEADHTPRIDYDHCKGCLVCVSVCPPHAIRAVPEHAAVEEPCRAPS